MRGGTVVLAILLGAVSTACGVSRDGGGLASVGDAVVSPREAYVTLVTTPSYAIGAQTLAKCLSHTGTSRPLVALVGSLVPDEIVHDLEDAGIRVIRVPDVRASAPIPLIDRPDFNSTFNKIHVWGLDKDYDRLVYLDADVLVLQNLDELFALELDEHMPFAAAPEIMPPDKFNTGVMVVKPSAMIYQKLLSAAAANEQPHDYDQGLLNRVFPNWFEQSAAHRLPFHFNVLQTVASYYEPAWNMLTTKMRVLHFAGAHSMKPWSYSGSISPSLAAYLYLWQSIARARQDQDISELFQVLNITDAAQINKLFQTGA